MVLSLPSFLLVFLYQVLGGLGIFGITRMPVVITV
jgi:hypothetical protein